MNTKDYIYLDEDLLNSHLAQFEKELLIKETSEHGSESSDSEKAETKTTTGINGLFGIGAKLQGEIAEGDSSIESEFTRSMVENVLNDYAVDLLIQDCDENNVLQDFNSASEGDFITYSSKFQIYDFEYLKSITDLECLNPFLNADNPPKKPGPHATKNERTEYQIKLAKYQARSTDANKNFKLVHDLSAFADRLLADSILITFNGGIAICKRNGIRLNKPQISFENESTRMVKIFGVVSSLKKETHPDGVTKQFNVNELDKVSSILFDITLSNFDMLHDNDKIIKPIAIYFEAD